MKRDTKRIEQILDNTRTTRKLVREEIMSGSSLQHVYDDLGNHEQTFSSRLKDLQEHNRREDAAEQASKPKTKTAGKEQSKPEGDPAAEQASKPK